MERPRTIAELRAEAHRDTRAATKAAERAVKPGTSTSRRRRHMNRATSLAFRARYHELVADKVELMGLDNVDGLPKITREACERQARQEVEVAWAHVMDEVATP